MPGYTEAIDGIGMEELFFAATDEPLHRELLRREPRQTRGRCASGRQVRARRRLRHTRPTMCASPAPGTRTKASPATSRPAVWTGSAPPCDDPHTASAASAPPRTAMRNSRGDEGAQDDRSRRDGLRRPDPDRRAGRQGLHRARRRRVASECVESLSRGRPHIFEPGVQEVFAEHVGTSIFVGHRAAAGHRRRGRDLRVDPGRRRPPSRPNLTNLAAAAAHVAERVRARRTLVVVRSTVPVGTSRRSRAAGAARRLGHAPGW